MKSVALSCRIMKTCERQYYNLNIVCFIILISDSSASEYETFSTALILMYDIYLYLTEASCIMTSNVNRGGYKRLGSHLPNYIWAQS